MGRLPSDSALMLRAVAAAERPTSVRRVTMCALDSGHESQSGSQGRLRLVGHLIQSGEHPGVTITREAVESTVEQLKRGPVPSFIEHDHTLPPVGRVVGGRIAELENGEIAAESIMEIFEETSPASIHSESEFDDAIRHARPVVAVSGPLEIVVDQRSYDVADLEALAETGRPAGDVVVRDSAIRFSAGPDPLLVIALGSGGVAWGWFAKGFFTRLGETLADEVGEDLKHAYRSFKDALRGTVAEKRRPIDQAPITLLTMNLERPGGGWVEIEGSTRACDETLDDFLDAGMALAVVGPAYIDLAAEPSRLVKIHFRYGRHGWQFAYALDADAERSWIAVLSDEEYEDLLRQAREGGAQ